MLKQRLLEAVKKAKIDELKNLIELDDIMFWNLQAENWSAQIPEHIKRFISKEINREGKHTNHIELGAGSVQYVKNSAVLDYSKGMLKRNPAKKKFLRNLSKPLRLKQKFDSASMVFVANYLENPQTAFEEIRKILKPHGKLTIVQSAKPLARLYQLQEYKAWTPNELIGFLKRAGFSAKAEEKKIKNTKLIFINASLQ